MTLISEIVTDVRAMLSERTESALEGRSFFLDSEIESWIKRSINALTIKTDTNYKVKAFTVGVTPQQSYTFLELSGGTNEMFKLSELNYKSVAFEDGQYDPLFSVSALDNLSYPDNESRRMTCTIYDDTVFLSKMPVEGDIIIVGGRWKSAAYTTTYPLNSHCEEATIAYCVAKGWLKKANQEMYISFWADWNMHMNDIANISSANIRGSDTQMLAVNKKSATIYKQSIRDNEITGF